MATRPGRRILATKDCSVVTGVSSAGPWMRPDRLASCRGRDAAQPIRRHGCAVPGLCRSGRVVRKHDVNPCLSHHRLAMSAVHRAGSARRIRRRAWVRPPPSGPGAGNVRVLPRRCARALAARSGRHGRGIVGRTRGTRPRLTQHPVHIRGIGGLPIRCPGAPSPIRDREQGVGTVHSTLRIGWAPGERPHSTESDPESDGADEAACACPASPQGPRATGRPVSQSVCGSPNARSNGGNERRSRRGLYRTTPSSPSLPTPSRLRRPRPTCHGIRAIRGRSGPWSRGLCAQGRFRQRPLCSCRVQALRTETSMCWTNMSYASRARL